MSAQQIFDAEFRFFSDLAFGLHVRLHEVRPHFTRLLRMVELTPERYLGNDIYCAGAGLRVRLTCAGTAKIKVAGERPSVLSVSDMPWYSELPAPNLKFNGHGFMDNLDMDEMDMEPPSPMS